MIIYLLGAFLLSAISGFLIIPAIMRFCREKKLYDLPNERKVHHDAIPRLGGIAFMPCMLISFVAILTAQYLTGGDKVIVNISSFSCIFGLILVYGIGILDDLLDIKPITKFVVLVVAASLLPLPFLYLNNLYGFLWIDDIPFYIGYPLTVFILVFINNAINLIDGIDGLASTLSILMLAVFLGYFMLHEVYIYTYCLLIAGLMGILCAYTYFNIFGNTEKGTKIFMGDSGSLTLGYFLGFIALKCAMNNTHIMPYRPEALLVPTTLFFVPVADAVRVSLYRIRHHRPVFGADKNHIHHKLMRAGCSQYQALLVIVALAIAYMILNWLIGCRLNMTWVVCIDIAVYVLFHEVLNLFIAKNTTNTNS